jgi:hypothetical protein
MLPVAMTGSQLLMAGHSKRGAALLSDLERPTEPDAISFSEMTVSFRSE